MCGGTITVMEQKKGDNKVTVSETKLPKRNKLRIILVALFVLLILGGITALVINSQHQHDNQEKSQMTEEELSSAVNAYNSKKQYQKAVDLIEIQYDKDSPTNQALLASVYFNKGDYSKSLKIYKSLEVENQLDQNTAEAAARTANKINDKQLAVNYYKKAIIFAKADTSNPVRGADVRYYNDQINRIDQGNTQ